MGNEVFEKNVLLKDYTTFKIGGPAKYFFVAKTKEDLILALKKAKEKKLPVFILAGGSNVLFSDKGFNGLVIKLQVTGCKLQGNKVYVAAGISLAKLAHAAALAGLTGFEWAAGIPGATVGGAIFGHAQAFGEKISDHIESVEALDIKTNKIKILSKKQCGFSLKNSIFKKNLPAGRQGRNLIIISAVFSLIKGDKKKIAEKTKELINYRKNNHPLAFPSAGSVFVNPEKNGKVIKAGELIEKAGLKGKRLGSAQISEQHANFIVNLGGAKAKDVAGLIELAQKKVKQKFGVSLVTEVRIIK